ncbi:MAG: hypothetical protein AUG74_17975 [Bacteroidetes bacterium 13_1_20CM_4_60_6]|nr:MAG: hypothetical protein AUG74_17975 [Bacteroidetes bacterium 13_1_20CM_4_60_6]
MQLRRGAEVGYAQAALAQLPLRRFDPAALARQLGRHGQIHVLLEPAQLDRRVVVRPGEVENLTPRPCGTAERRKTDGESGVPPLPKGEGARG